MADSPDGGFGGSTDTGQAGQTGSNASDNGGGNDNSSPNTDPNSSVESDAARGGAWGGPPSTGFSPGEGISGADQGGFVGGEPAGPPGSPPSGGDGVTTSFRELGERFSAGTIRGPEAVLSGFLATLTAVIPGAGLLAAGVREARERGLDESPPSFADDPGRGSGNDACGGLYGHCFVPPPVRSTAPPVPGALPAGFDFLPAGSPYDAPQPWVPGEGVTALAESVSADPAPAAAVDQGGAPIWPALAALGLILAVADG